MSPVAADKSRVKATAKTETPAKVLPVVEVKWEAPPLGSARRSTGEYDALDAALREHAGEWALIHDGNTVWNVPKRFAGGDFERRTKKIKGDDGVLTYKAWIRFLGTKQEGLNIPES